MGPRPYERGKALRHRRVGADNLRASMGPRSCERGMRPGTEYLGQLKYPLQWGRAPKSTE